MSSVPSQRLVPAERRPIGLFFYQLPIALLLFSSAIKPDLENLANARFRESLTVSELTIFLKENTTLIYAAILLSFAVAFLHARKLTLAATLQPLLFAAVYLYGAAVASFADPALAQKMAIAAGALLVAHVFLSSVSERVEDICKVVAGGFVLFALALVAINMWEYLAGHGFVVGFPRFFGTSSHPNFIGVQCAFCSVVLLSARVPRSVALQFGRYAFLAAAIWLVYLSGSRTALVVLVVGASVAFALQRQLSTVMVLGLGLLCAAVLMIALGLLDQFALLDSDVYDRGGSNTRVEAWGTLWEIVKEAPILGHGYLPRFSENSWLRGWATIGIFYPLALAIIVASLATPVLESRPRTGSPDMRMLYGVVAGLTAGSLLEGYLFDTNSLAWWAWYIAVAGIGLRLGRDHVPHHGPLDTMAGVPRHPRPAGRRSI